MARTLPIGVFFKTTKRALRSYQKAAKEQETSMSEWIRRALLSATINGSSTRQPPKTNHHD